MEFYYNTQTITLINGEDMAKYIHKGQQDGFNIFFNGAIKLDSVGVEIMIYNGEIFFTGNVYDEGKLGELPGVTKCILSNNFFIINYIENKLKIYLLDIKQLKIHFSLLS